MQVKVNQIYKAPMMGGRVLRRIRILAHHPDGGYLYEILYTGQPTGQHEKLGRVTDLSIREAYVLEQDVCDHHGPKTEIYLKKSESPSHWKCLLCEDIFPLIGDTCLWFPKLKVEF